MPTLLPPLKLKRRSIRDMPLPEGVKSEGDRRRKKNRELGVRSGRAISCVSKVFSGISLGRVDIGNGKEVEKPFYLGSEDTGLPAKQGRLVPIRGVCGGEWRTWRRFVDSEEFGC